MYTSVHMYNSIDVCKNYESSWNGTSLRYGGETAWLESCRAQVSQSLILTHFFHYVTQEITSLYIRQVTVDVCRLTAITYPTETETKRKL